MKASLAALLATIVAARLPAQVVTGTVLSAGDRTPVAGAIVILAAPSGGRVNATLTNDSGGFRLRAPGAGSFGLRVDVVGYESQTAPPVPDRSRRDGHPYPPVPVRPR